VSETIKIQPNLKPENAAIVSPSLLDRKIDEITAGLAASCAKNLRLLSNQENITYSRESTELGRLFKLYP